MTMTYQNNTQTPDIARRIIPHIFINSLSQHLRSGEMQCKAWRLKGLISIGNSGKPKINNLQLGIFSVVSEEQVLGFEDKNYIK